MANASTTVTSLLCEEMLSRTQVQCDAETDFQRIVSTYVAARHGTWTFSQQDQSWSLLCTQCGQRRCSTNAHGTPTTARLQERIAAEEARERRCEWAAHNGYTALRTPACSLWEQTTSRGCVYTAEARGVLDRRAEFRRTEGAAIARLKAASRGIQDCIV